MHTFIRLIDISFKSCIHIKLHEPHKIRKHSRTNSYSGILTDDIPQMVAYTTNVFCIVRTGVEVGIE